jgi:GDP-4-dehydro-6-deoxy-D-mannose reductase
VTPGAVLVTGAAGFVGRHLRRELGGRAVSADVDVTDAEAVAARVRQIMPTAVVHLAAQSSVGDSWGAAAMVWHVNVVGTVNVLDAVAGEAPGARVVVASSGEVYGRADRIPTPEDEPLRPLSPYAASKAAAELAAERAARSEGADVVVARPFAHTGPGQDERFAVASWAAQIAHAEAAGGGTIRVGDLSASRDFLDVRDVCRAYVALLDVAVARGTYNIATGQPVTMERVLDELVSLAAVAVDVEVDPSRLRPVAVPVASGDAERLRARTGWRPLVPRPTTLADTLGAARRQLADTAATETT